MGFFAVCIWTGDFCQKVKLGRLVESNAGRGKVGCARGRWAGMNTLFSRSRVVGVASGVLLAMVGLVLGLVLVVLVLGMGGCAGKPGSEALHPEGLEYRDPSLTHSTAQLGFNSATQIGGPLSQETSKIGDGTMQETSGGGAAKQRLAVRIDGQVLEVMFSAASDLKGTMARDADGNITGITFQTDNAAVQRAVNDGVAVLVAQWTAASANERAVLEAKLRAQSETGSAVASAALQIVALLK